MIIFTLFLVYVAAMVGWAFRHSPKVGRYDEMSPRGFRLIFAIVPSIAYVVVSVICAGIAYDKSADISNSRYVIEQLAAQRDDMSALFEDTLTNEDFIRLMEASTPDDIKFLATRPQVTQFLLGKADRLVDVNARLFAEQNQLLDKARSVCNYTDNPLVPKLPFIGPDCALGSLEESFK